jgi:hypothetical protein
MTDATSTPPPDPTEPAATPAASSPPPPPLVPVAGGSSPVAAGVVKVRSAVAVIVFSIITFGIYHLYWTYQVFRELKETTRQGIGPIIGLLIAFVFNPINWFVLPSEIGNMYAAQGKEKPVSGVTGLWNIIPLIGFIIWVVKVQGALNHEWESMGA